MTKARISLLSFCLCLTLSVCSAQNFEVSEPGLSLIDNTVHITYDILNSNRSDSFIVSMNITDSEGNTIDAKALSGDIGEGINGGRGKLILWDLEADGIVMNSTIFVKIRAKLIPPTVVQTPVREQPVIVEEPQERPVVSDPVAEESTMEENRPSTSGSKNLSRGSIMLQSLVLPGMGLTHVTGNPHWIKGVAGYGCLAGSVVLNRKAIKSYDDIYDLTGYDEKDELLQKSVKQDNISETLAYAAIGIWVADLVWTWIGTNKLEYYPYLSEGNGLSFETKMDPLTRTPLIGVMYRF